MCACAYFCHPCRTHNRAPVPHHRMPFATVQVHTLLPFHVASLSSLFLLPMTQKQSRIERPCLHHYTCVGVRAETPCYQQPQRGGDIPQLLFTNSILYYLFIFNAVFGPSNLGWRRKIITSVSRCYLKNNKGFSTGWRAAEEFYRRHFLWTGLPLNKQAWTKQFQLPLKLAEGNCAPRFKVILVVMKYRMQLPGGCIFLIVLSSLI